MKKILTATLTSTLTLVLLSACGGQTQINPTMAYGNQYGQTPYQQSGYAYQNPNLMAQQNQNLSNPAQAQYSQGFAAQQPTQTQATTQQALNAPQTNATRTATKAPAAPVQRAATASTARPSAAATPTRQAAAAPAAPKLSAAQALLLNARKRVQTLNSAKTVVSCFETNAEKGPTNLKANMMFMAGTTKLEVISHQNSLFVGAKLSYQAGSPNVTARAAGALGIVKVNAPMTDKRILTRRGYRLDQIDVFAIANRLLNGKSEPKVLGKTLVNGRNIAILEFTNANDFDKEVTRELLGIDMEDYFVRIHEMYAGSELVFSLKLENLQLNAPISAQDLEI
jgi:hypothetical protein